MSWQDFSERNALRPPDWRWRRARLAASGELPLSRKRDQDRWVRDAAAFLKQSKSGGPSPSAEVMLAERWPSIYWAHRYWTLGEGDAPGPDAGRRTVAARYELEARVLSGATPDEIADRTGMMADDVEAFERLFFDVRPRLAQRSYIASQVIGPALHRGLFSREYDVLWKAFAYQFGPATLDALVSTFDSPRRRVEPDAVSESLAKGHRFDLLRQAIMAGKTFRLTNDSQSMAIQLNQEAVKLQQLLGAAAGGAADAQVANTVAALGAMVFHVGKPSIRNAQLAALDSSGVEPAGSDLFAFSTGRDVEIDPERLALTFPEPAARREAVKS